MEIGAEKELVLKTDILEKKITNLKEKCSVQIEAMEVAMAEVKLRA